MENQIKLTICTVTYNHKDYIAQALDSFLMQKTNFKFQVIVGDDCSTDGTIEILKKYAKKYPNIIKPIFRKKNSGGSQNSLDIYRQIKTPYVAMCEGDDYWTDEYKLQKQIDFLEANSDYTICFHPVRVIFEGFDFQKPDEIYPTQEMIEYGATFEALLFRWNFIQTNSAVYRWVFDEKYFNRFLYISPGDYYIHLLHAKFGKIKMLPDIMSVYRRHPRGIWSNTITNIDKHHLIYGLREINWYYEVYKNIADSSPRYLHDVFLPTLKMIVDVYYRNRKFKELQNINGLYSQYLDLVLPNEVKCMEKITRLEQKYKKYKKLSKIALIFIIIQVFVIVVLHFL